MAINTGLGLGTLGTFPNAASGTVLAGDSTVHAINLPNPPFDGVFDNGDGIVNISLTGSRNLVVALHPDTNGNGRFELDQDGFITADNNISSTSFPDASVTTRVFDPVLYFAVVSVAPGFTNSGIYTLRASTTPVRQPPNLAAREINEGNITSDRTTSSRFLDGFDNVSNIHAFTLGATDGINLRLFGLQNDYDLRIIRDVNNNRVVDPGDELFRSARGGTSDETINNVRGAGNYLAQVYQFTPSRDTNYRLQFDHFTTTAQGPLNSRVEEEFQVGNLSADLRRRGQVGEQDEVDSYAFSLDENETLNLLLTGRRGDAYLRVVQDRNNNNRIERREVVAASTGIGNTDVINGLSGAGDYLIQIWQVEDNARYRLKFDLNPTNAAPIKS